MLKNIFSKMKLKILFIIVLSFLLVKNGTSLLFIADSPNINPLFVDRLHNLPSEIVAIPNNLIDSLASIKIFPFLNKQNSLAEVKIVTPSSDIVFRNISKNVSAAEDTNIGEKYIKVEAGTKYKIVGTVVVNGKEYPKIEFLE